MREKAKLGQHFLTDMLAQKRIFDALGDAVTGTVIEIGPGKAALTDLLASVAERLIAIELDSRLAGVLRNRFQPVPTVEIVRADILKVDLARYAKAERSLAIVGNLPYYITSPILHRLFACEALIRRAVVMVQREVGERMAARPGSRAYGLLSVMCQIHADTQLLFNLPPAAFSPPPEVYSSVLRMEFAPFGARLGVELPPFVRFLEKSFAQKRKTLTNNLKAAGYSAELVEHAEQSAGLGASVRAEELKVEEFAQIFRILDSQAQT